MEFDMALVNAQAKTLYTEGKAVNKLQEMLHKEWDNDTDTARDDEYTNGTSAGQNHYKSSAMQPIQVMQRIMTVEQFKGFLIGNVIKYSMRAGHKDAVYKDYNKARQYMWWLHLVNQGRTIDPLRDVVPDKWDAKLTGCINDNMQGSGQVQDND